MKKIFTYQARIFLRDTDATGVLFAPEQLRMASETLEMFLMARGLPLKELCESPYLFPVVHLESDYMAPVYTGDAIEITLFLKKMGTTSVTLAYTFFDKDRKMEVGKAEVVHVAIDRALRTKIPVPEILKGIFSV